ncbi:ROK family protein [Brachybacterium epidermidis]
MSKDQGRGASSPQLMRRANRQALLRLALRGAAFTAADAMAATGLTRATVLGVCAELVSAGWLEQVDGAPAGGSAQRGRPARRYALRSAAAVLAGVDAGEHTLTARVADLCGRTLATVHHPIDQAEPDPSADRTAMVTALIDRVLARAGVPGTPRVLTVVGVPAPVDQHGRSPHDDDFWQRMNPGFVDALGTVPQDGNPGAGPGSPTQRAAAGGAVLVENDANLAAIAEHAGGIGSHVATLLMGERFGAGLIVDGRLLRGASGGAGEMRFLDVALDDERGADGVAALARRWSLEALAGDGALDDGAGVAARSELARISAERITAVDVFAAADRGDELARAVMERIGDRLARIAVILASLLGVETVVVAGAIADAVEPVLERARTRIPALTGPPHPRLVASMHGSEVVVRGAIELALARLREDPLEYLDQG